MCTSVICIDPVLLHKYTHTTTSARAQLHELVMIYVEKYKADKVHNIWHSDAIKQQHTNNNTKSPDEQSHCSVWPGSSELRPKPEQLFTRILLIAAQSCFQRKWSCDQCQCVTLLQNTKMLLCVSEGFCHMWVCSHSRLLSRPQIFLNL